MLQWYETATEQQIRLQKAFTKWILGMKEEK